jgi:hypothetical protein
MLKSPLIRLVVIPYVGLALLAFTAFDTTKCAREGGRMGAAAIAGAHGGLQTLAAGGRSNDQQALANAERYARERMGDAADARITARIGDDRRSMTVTVERPGPHCVAQIFGLTGRDSASEVAALPPPGAPRATSTRMCILPIC